MSASFSPEISESAQQGVGIGSSSTEGAPPVRSALAAFFTPAPQAAPAQLAQADEAIAGSFVAPVKPPLPPARPNFGDRVRLAESTAAQAEDKAQPATATVALTPAAAPESALPALAIARAENVSLGAYEYKTAGVPLPEGGLRATNVAFTPTQFEVAGARASSSGAQRWRAAYDNVDVDCFPETLRQALDKIAEHFKSEVQVTSGRRDRGRRGSLHRSCKAADIRVAGVSPGEVARVARTIPGVNGVGTYRRVAVTHVDVRAERFAWRW